MGQVFTSIHSIRPRVRSLGCCAICRVVFKMRHAFFAVLFVHSTAATVTRARSQKGKLACLENL